MRRSKAKKNHHGYIVPSLLVVNTFFWLLFHCFNNLCSESNFFLVLPSSAKRGLVGYTARGFAQHFYTMKNRNPDGDVSKQGMDEDDESVGYYEFREDSPGLPECRPIDSSNEIDVSLVTQTSIERLHVMEEICERWTGPISIVVANANLTDADLRRRLAEMGCYRRQNRVVTASTYQKHYDRAKYPVNTLRNMALRQATTTHALYHDIDLVPSKSLRDDILRHKELLRDSPKNAIVVPAFQLNPPNIPECQEQGNETGLRSEECSQVLHELLPATKADLLQQYGHPFDEPEPRVYQFTGREHYHGHSSTGYVEWIQQLPHHSLEPLNCLRSVRYEPYMVVRRCKDLPPVSSVSPVSLHLRQRSSSTTKPA